MTRLTEGLLPTRRGACLTLAAMLSAAVCAPAFAADEFPSKPVTFIVPYQPGTTADLWARMISAKLSALWKQPVIVDNKPGGGTTIAMNYVMRSNPDGHTLLLGSLSTAMAKLTNAAVTFDPQVELVPVFKYLNFKIVFATNTATYAKAKTLGELVAFSKAKPEGIFFGGTGPGTAFNMSSGFVLKALGMNYSEINYNGTQPITLALIRNDVQILSNTPTSLKAQFDSGTLHPIAALSEERYPDLPNVQTVREAGYKGFLPVIWNGVFAAKGTPKAVLDKIAADLYAVTTAPDMKERVESSFAGSIPKSTPALFAQELEADTRQWRSYLASINFKPQ